MIGEEGGHEWYSGVIGEGGGCEWAWPHWTQKVVEM